MSADGSGRTRRPWRMLLERDVAEIERRLALLYRANCPKRSAEEMGVHLNTVCTINLARHPVQVRLGRINACKQRCPHYNLQQWRTFGHRAQLTSAPIKIPLLANSRRHERALCRAV